MHLGISIGLPVQQLLSGITLVQRLLDSTALVLSLQTIPQPRVRRQLDDTVTVESSMSFRYRLDGGAWTEQAASALPFTIPGADAYTNDQVEVQALGDIVNPVDVAASGDDPVVSTIFADGWQATYPSPPADVTGNTVTVTRSGYNALGVATTFDEDLDITARVRQPGVATDTADTVALSHYIYSGETVTGVTNSSTLAYPYAQFAWLVPDFQEVGDGQNSITLKIAVAHRHARDGKPVAGVRLIVRDHLGAEASELVTSCTGKAYTASGFTASIYEGTVDIASLSTAGDPSGPNNTDFENFTIDAEFLPWVGGAHKISVITSGKSRAQNATLQFVNNRSGWRDKLYAYVSTTGDNGTGVVSTDPAVARASPFATTAGANGAQSTWHTANTGRNVMDGSVIRLEAGTHTHTVWPRRFCDAHAVILEGAEGTTAANVIYQDSGSTATNGIAEILHVKNITIRKSSAGSVTIFDPGASGIDYSNTASTYLAMEGVILDANGHAPSGNFFDSFGGSYFENCSQNADLVAAQKIVGCSGNFTAASTVACVASRVPNGNIEPNTADRANGLFIGWSHITAARADFLQVLFVDHPTTALGIGVVGSVLESYGSGGSGPAFLINGDGNTDSSENITLTGNTFIGGRANLGYTDAGGSTRYDHTIIMRFNVFYERNTKAGDFFGYQSSGTNPARVGNWRIRYEVGANGNTIIQGESRDNFPSEGFYPLSWLGDVASEGSIAGSQASPLSVAFTNDQSGASGAGNGDYTPTSGTGFSTIPSGLAPYPFDLSGAAISAGGVAGALQL